jgi:hypothetical protein
MTQWVLRISLCAPVQLGHHRLATSLWSFSANFVVRYSGWLSLYQITPVWLRESPNATDSEMNGRVDGLESPTSSSYISCKPPAVGERSTPIQQAGRGQERPFDGLDRYRGLAGIRKIFARMALNHCSIKRIRVDALPACWLDA